MGLPVLRSRLGVVASALAVAVPVAGCGSGVHASKAPHAGQGATGSTRVSQPSKARAQAYVKAVNLRAKDLPGFKGSVSEEHETATEKQLSAGMKRCLGAQARTGTAGISWAPPSRRSKGMLGNESGGGRVPAGGDARKGAGSGGALAEGSSEEYERKGAGGIAFAESEVSVARSAAGAAVKLAALRSGRVRYCLQQYLNRLVAHEPHGRGGVKMGKISVGEVTPPAPGATGGFGWKLTVPLSAGGIKLPLRMEIIGFVDGPAQVTLTTGAVPVAFPGKAERSLYMLLLRRAESQRI